MIKAPDRGRGRRPDRTLLFRIPGLKLCHAPPGEIKQPGFYSVHGGDDSVRKAYRNSCPPPRSGIKKASQRARILPGPAPLPAVPALPRNCNKAVSAATAAASKPPLPCQLPGQQGLQYRFRSVPAPGAGTSAPAKLQAADSRGGSGCNTKWYRTFAGPAPAVSAPALPATPALTAAQPSAPHPKTALAVTR